MYTIDDIDVDLENTIDTEDNSDKELSLEDILAKSYDDQVSPKEDQKEEVTKVNEEVYEAPNGLPAHLKEAFKAYPKEIQKHIVDSELERQRSFTQRTQEIAENERQVFNLVNNTFTQEELNVMQAQGYTPMEIIQQTIAFQRSFNQNPQAVLQEVANHYGLTLGQLEQIQNSDSNNPQIIALQNQINQLQNTIQQRDFQAQEELSAMEHQDNISLIEEFVSAKNGDKLMFPYAQKVLPDLIPLAKMLKIENPSLKATDLLIEAYNLAIYKNLEVRGLIEAEIKKQGIAEHQTSKKQIAQKAKTVGSSIVSSGTRLNNPYASGEKMSLEEILSEKYDELS